MSYYLHFRKGGKDIVSYCRCTRLYQCLHELAPWEKWERVSIKDLELGKDICHKELKRLNEDLYKFEKILSGNLTYEDRYSVVDAVIETENDIDDFQKILAQIDMLIDICNQKQITEPEEEGGDWQEEESPMEWGIF